MIHRPLLLTVLSVSVAVAAPCNVQDRMLVGSWAGVGKRAVFEQMSFELDGSRREFNSWLHERPEIWQAQWQLQDCRLSIRESSNITQTFTVSLRGKRLILSSSDGKTSSAYRKIEE